MKWMTRVFARRTIPLIVGAFVLGALVVGTLWGVISSADGRGTTVSSKVPVSTPRATPGPSPSSAPSAPATATCPAGGKTVSNADQLQAALSAAKPGATIVLAPGTYVGNFQATTSGTAANPITLCGESASILDGDSTGKGYVFHLDRASYWHLVGFSVRNGQKGVVADGTVGSVIQGLTVSGIGDEGIHLRATSTDNLVTGNTVSNTGLLKAKFGEGIYIGTAKSNWCDYSGCQPDKSDRNVISKNTISHTTAENVDIKEGTTGGTLSGNSFDGSGLSGGTDSWVDVKGNDWIIEGNTGTTSPKDGFQTHQIVDGWGTRNVFRNNIAHVNGPGFGFALRPALNNVVECNNTVAGAASGTSNVSCTGG